MRPPRWLTVFWIALLAASWLRAEPVASPAGGAPPASEVPAAEPVADEPVQPVARVNVVPGRGLTWQDATVLGLVEGVTEFLPVSSTGHLIIAAHFLSLDDERQLTDARGNPRWVRAPTPERPEGKPLTLKGAVDAYCIVIQAGAIAAVVVLYWTSLWSLVLGFFGMDREGSRLLRNVILAAFPAATIGLLFNNWIDANLFSEAVVIAALAVGAVVMLVVDRIQRRGSWGHAESRRPAELSAGEAVVVGGMQCLALWPGMSRSMMTIVGGYMVGLSPARAAEFSFLIGVPTLTGAALFKGYKSGPAMLELFGWEPIVIGLGVSFITAALAIKVLVAVLTRVGLTPFAVYRFIVAGALAIVLWG